MIMVSDLAVEHAKEVKSIHTIFARAGMYNAGPLDYQRDAMHSGRAWGSDTITVTQGDRLLSRGLVLLNTVEPDLMRHGHGDARRPRSRLAVGRRRSACSRASRAARSTGPTRPRPTARRSSTSGSSSTESYDSVAANQAILAWCQPGVIIGLAMRPHADTVDIREAHRTISTGVIAHTCHFHDAVRRRRLAPRRAQRVASPVADASSATGRCSRATAASWRRSSRTAWRARSSSPWRAATRCDALPRNCVTREWYALAADAISCGSWGRSAGREGHRHHVVRAARRGRGPTGRGRTRASLSSRTRPRASGRRRGRAGLPPTGRRARTPTPCRRATDAATAAHDPHRGRRRP